MGSSLHRLKFASSLCLSAAAVVAGGGTCSRAIAGITGLQVEYAGYLGGKHVWDVFAVNTGPATEEFANVGNHVVTSGTMSQVQHSDGSAAQGGSWRPSLTPSGSIALDSFVTIGRSGGSTDSTILDPGFGSGLGPVIPASAGWFAFPPFPQFSSGRLLVMRVAGSEFFPGAPGGYSASLQAVSRVSGGSFLPSDPLSYTIPGPCTAPGTASVSTNLWQGQATVLLREFTGLAPSPSGALFGVRASGVPAGGASVRVLIDNILVGTLSMSVAGCQTDCRSAACLPVRFLSIPAATYNAAVADGTLSLRAEVSGIIMCPDVPGQSFPFNLIEVSIWPGNSDCDGNSIADSCQLAGKDCNGNGRLDSCDIASGAADANGDGIPDSCQAPSPDLNGDGFVDGDDLGTLLAAWGPGNGPADLNRDGFVDGNDLGTLLAAWGPVP